MICLLFLGNFSDILGLTIGKVLGDYWDTLGNWRTYQWHPASPSIPSVLQSLCVDRVSELIIWCHLAARHGCTSPKGSFLNWGLMLEKDQILKSFQRSMVGWSKEEQRCILETWRTLALAPCQLWKQTLKTSLPFSVFRLWASQACSSRSQLFNGSLGLDLENGAPPGRQFLVKKIAEKMLPFPLQVWKSKHYWEQQKAGSNSLFWWNAALILLWFWLHMLHVTKDF